jgi:hypothetical protein
MDWIEQLFGVSPDHGDHSVEISILLSALAVVVVVSLILYRRFAGSRTRDYQTPGRGQY